MPSPTELEICKLTAGNTVNYYHTDAIGSTRLVTDQNRHILFSDGYQPYGQNNGTPGGTEVFRFTGKPYSSSIGLYYYLHRWYDPSIGRFVSPDPKHGRLSNPQSLNLYIYVVDIPTSLTDPTGEISEFHDRPCAGSCSGPDPLFTAVSKWWNGLDSNEKTIVVSIVIIVVVTVATAGIGTASVAPVLLGATLGGGLSGEFYAATCGSSKEGWSAEGYASHILSGIALGSLGGIAGPAAGAVSSELVGSEVISAAAAPWVTRLTTGAIEGGAQLSTDLFAGRPPAATLLDFGVAFGAGFLQSPGPVESQSSFGQIASNLADITPTGRDVMLGTSVPILGSILEDYVYPFLNF